MRGKKLLVLLISTGLVLSAHAQEIQARITINSSRVSSQIDKKVFQTLQTALHNFLNNRKWTNETFQQNEKINCNFLLNINQAGDGNIYKASLTVQAARPVYNTSYETPLINFMDESVTFKYVEYQQVEFNENRVGGSDGLASNLSATLAFYVDIMYRFMRIRDNLVHSRLFITVKIQEGDKKVIEQEEICNVLLFVVQLWRRSNQK